MLTGRLTPATPLDDLDSANPSGSVQAAFFKALGTDRTGRGRQNKLSCLVGLGHGTAPAHAYGPHLDHNPVPNGLQT